MAQLRIELGLSPEDVFADNPAYLAYWLENGQDAEALYQATWSWIVTYGTEADKIRAQFCGSLSDSPDGFTERENQERPSARPDDYDLRGDRIDEDEDPFAPDPRLDYDPEEPPPPVGGSVSPAGGSVANVDAELTLAGVTDNFCNNSGYWNNTRLIVGPMSAAGSCPNIAIADAVSISPGCTAQLGTEQSFLFFDLCTACGSLGALPPVLRVRALYSLSSTLGPYSFTGDFLVSGAELEPIIDQLLATGTCQLPFFAQGAINSSTLPNPPTFDFSQATCTLRIFPRP